MTTRMTEGNPLKLILTFALPLLGGNLFQQLYNIADAAIVGQFLGSKALASVGASSSIQFLVLGFCIGISCGFSIPVAQRFGAKDLKEMRSYIFHSYLMTLFFAVFLTITCVLSCHGILHILKTPENIYADAYVYLLILFCGIPFNLLYKYDEGEIYTWDYVMEQRAKQEWDDKHFGDPNPYADLPRMQILTFTLPKMVRDEAIENNEVFKFHEFFRVWTEEDKNT